MPRTIKERKVNEKKWAEAKAQAAKEGKGGNYGYIMTIYESMAHIEKSIVVPSIFIPLQKGKVVSEGTVRGRYIKKSGKWVYVQAASGRSDSKRLLLSSIRNALPVAQGVAYGRNPQPN